MKIASFIKAPQGMGKADFSDLVVNIYAKSVAENSKSLLGAVVRLVTPPPEGISELWLLEPGSDFLEFDALLELWYPTEEDYRREVLKTESILRERGAAFATYGVRPNLLKDPRTFESGSNCARPELTFIACIKLLKSADRKALIEHYYDHAPIALRTQPAFTKYEQNVVLSNISWSDNVPLLDCYSDFSFATAKDQVERMIPTQEEFQDVVDFVDKFWPRWLTDSRPVA